MAIAEIDWSSYFYSTSFERKIEGLNELEGKRVDIRDVLDAICDGAGGCERMSYGTPAGTTCWVSVLTEHNWRTHYAYIEVSGDPHHAVADVLSTTWVSIGSMRWATDSVEAYAEVIRCVQAEEAD